MAEITSISGGGASNAVQASGGDSSQNNAVASKYAGMTPEQQKAAEDFENYGKYQYKEQNTQKAIGNNFNNYQKYQYKDETSSRANIDILKKDYGISKESSDSLNEFVDQGGTIKLFKNEDDSVSILTGTNSRVIQAQQAEAEKNKAYNDYLDNTKRQVGDITISEREYRELHPNESQEPIKNLDYTVEDNLVSLEKVKYYKENGDYLSAYNEDVNRRTRKLPNARESQSVTYAPLNYQSDKFQVTQTELIRTTPFIGSAATLVQTALFDAKGNFSPIRSRGKNDEIINARIADYEYIEGKTGRLDQVNSGAIDLATFPLTFAGGGVVSGVVGTAGKGLAKLAGTRAGSAVTNFITKPWISNDVIKGIPNAITASSGFVSKFYNKLPSEVRKSIYKIGKETLSISGLSTIGSKFVASAAGMDGEAIAMAKKSADMGFEIFARKATTNEAVKTAYYVYTNPLISAANAQKLADVIKNNNYRIIAAEARFSSKHPVIYKAGVNVKNAFSTPGAAAMNTAQIAYFGDAGYRIATSDDKLKTAGQIAIEIPAGYVGAKFGMKVVDKTFDKLATRGRTFVPIEEIGYAEGIPLGKGMTAQTLETSFAMNTPIPRPYMFGRTNYQNQPAPKDASLSLSNPSNSKYGEETESLFPGMVWHATPQGERLGKNIIVGDSTSELPGIYTSEVGIGYYLHLEQANKFRPAFLITSSNPSYTPKFATFRVDKTERIPSSYKGIDEQARFLRENASPIKAYAPNMKEEYEALLPPGANFSRVGKGYYTVINGRRVAIDEYAPNLDIGLDFINSKVLQKTELRTLTNEDVIDITKNRANRLYKDKNDSKYRIYKFSSGSSYGRASGRQIPLGSSSYGGSKALRSISKYGKSSSGSSSSGIPDFSLSSFGKSSSRSYTGDSSFKYSPGKSSTRSSQSGSSPSKFVSAIGGTSRTSTKAIQSPYQSKKITAPLKNKKDNKIKLDVDYYKAAQRGRIDHLSIVDPLEMLGKGSLTNRNRADMTLYKQPIYLVDNSISTKKPSKRFKI